MLYEVHTHLILAFRKDAIQVYGADPDADATKPLANGNTVVLTRKGVTGAEF